MTKAIRKLVIATAVSALVASASFAAPSIDVTPFGNGAAFSTDFTYGQAWVKVSGPQGYVQKHELGSLDDLSFVLDESAVDGNYSWEILAVAPIAKETRAKLDAGAAAGDRGIVDRMKASGELQSATFFGSFKLVNGAIQTPTQNFSGSDQDLQLKAQVFADDLVAQGNLCLGVDCPTSPNFGFDTILMRENNLRIKFEDTSSSATFPGNDWELIANDSNNNGENHFSLRDVDANTVPFKVLAGAPNGALYVAANGNVGVGTTNPATIELNVTDGDSPTLRLEQDGSAGFQSQTWDLAGNETNFFIRDTTNSSILPFRIKPNTAENTLFMTNKGLGSGVTDDGPVAPLHVRGGGTQQDPSNNAVLAVFQNNANVDDGAIVSILAGTGSANAQMWFGDADDDNAGRIIYRNNSDSMSLWTAGAERLFINETGGICVGCDNTLGNAIRHNNGASLSTGGVWNNASSRALKRNINDLSAEDAMAALKEIAPVTYNYNAEPEETYVGFIAEDVPELVAMNSRKSLTSMDVVAMLTKVVQEQQKAIEILMAERESKEIE